MVCEEDQEDRMKWVSRRSDELKVGQIIKIKDGQRLPADLILLAANSNDGKVYIETGSLDGEKNLKVRSVVQQLQQIYNDIQVISKIDENKPLVSVEEPSEQLYSFTGSIQYFRTLLPKDTQNKKANNTPSTTKHRQISSIPLKTTHILKPQNFLFRQSVLRNTGQITGVIAYAGHYTKSMMNSSSGTTKMSQIERKVNIYMICIFILQIILVLLCGTLNIFTFYSTTHGMNFSTLVLHSSTVSSIQQGALTSLSYFILLNTLIPISLLVSIEVIKYGQGLLIGADNLISKVDAKGQTVKARAFRSVINQELGMVKYVLTDKTGTLTRNQMSLKRVVVEGKEYGKGKDTQDSGFNGDELMANSYMNIHELNSKLFKALQKQSSSQSPNSLIFNQSPYSLFEDSKSLSTLMLIIMTTCHTCIRAKNFDSQTIENKQDKTKKQNIQYHGPSPDQIALVSSAVSMGFQFVENSFGKVKLKIDGSNTGLKNNYGGVLEFQVEDIFQFDSDRKRMSIVISNALLPNFKILFCKGADSSISPLLTQTHFTNNTPQNESLIKTNNLLTSYSKLGLRTLLFSYRLIPTETYSHLHTLLIQYQSQQNLKKYFQTLQQIEANMTLCGATAVQDKLQDQVPETIQDLIKANIKVCMLTGDKMQTAQNIAKSCGLFQQELNIIRIADGNGDMQIYKGYMDAREWEKKEQPFGIVVQGSAINLALQSSYFSEMIEKCQSAVCCRITPKNKAEVVLFIKNELKQLVLSIGDGANDVPMIQAANIGIGLYGNQGMNAVQASDFAIPQFKCLWRLLFVHGRWNYIRIAELIKYFFYKNLVFTLGQLWYAYLCGFSGTSVYEATYLVLYNTIFTAVPVIVKALLEQDLNYVQIINDQSQLQEEKINHIDRQGKKVEREQLREELLSSRVSGEKLKKPQMGTERGLGYIKTVKSLSFGIQNQVKCEQEIESNKRKLPSTSLSTSRIQIDKHMKHLFPLLYSHSQAQLSLTPKIFILLVFESTAESFFIFLSIYFGIQSNSFWVFSIIMYTVIFGLVTIRICYDVNYWTWIMVFAILGTSVIPYLVFIYVMSVISWELSGTFVEIFGMMDFYLCLGLALGAGSFLQAGFSVMNKYYFPTVVDFVRKQWKSMQEKDQEEKKQQKSLQRIERRKQIESKYQQMLQSSRVDRLNESIVFEDPTERKMSKGIHSMEVQLQQIHKLGSGFQKKK